MSCAVCVWALGFEGSRRPSTLQCIPMAAYAFGAGSRGLRAVWACAAQVQATRAPWIIFIDFAWGGDGAHVKAGEVCYGKASWRQLT